jgi:hypothetical protein
MLLLTIFLAKPMFRINKPLLIPKQTTHVTWQNIPWLVREYFSTSLIYMANEYIKKNYDMEKNILKYSFLLTWANSRAHAHL